MKPIRNSVKAVIIQDNQLLLTKNVDAEGYFYLFPGGGQEHGEQLSDTLIRECMEEIGQKVIAADLLHIREYIGKNHQFAEWDSGVHQVEFYFQCSLENPEAELGNGIQPDEHQVAVEWVPIERLNEIRLYPQTLGTMLREGSKSPAYLGDTN
jgi:8-oxo-dGTP diphosphatase